MLRPEEETYYRRFGLHTPYYVQYYEILQGFPNFSQLAAPYQFSVLSRRLPTYLVAQWTVVIGRAFTPSIRFLCSFLLINSLCQPRAFGGHVSENR